jgi:F-box and WD-40 domain protein CDC4
LRASKGVLTSVAVYDGANQSATTPQPTTHPASKATGSRHLHISPSGRRASSRTTRSLGTARSRLGRVASATSSSAPGLATPETEGTQFRLDHQTVLRKRIHGEKLGHNFNTNSSNDYPDALQSSTSRPPLFTRTSSQAHDNAEKTVSAQENSRDSQHSLSASEGLDSEETMIEESETRQYPESSTAQSYRTVSGGPNLPAIDSALSQDMCLPSPSLSPVTAMNTHNPDSFFEFTEDQGT